MRLRSPPVTLFKGERVARVYHACDACGRDICPGEHSHVTVLLIQRGFVQVTRKCPCAGRR